MADNTTSSGSTSAKSASSSSTTTSSGATVTSSGSSSSSGTSASQASSASTTTSTPGATVTKPNGIIPGGLASAVSKSSDSTMTGCTIDDEGNLILEENVTFSYKLGTTLAADSIFTGFLPEGLYFDTASSRILGTPRAVTATVITITTPSQGSNPVAVPIIIRSEMELAITGGTEEFTTNLVMPVERGPGDSPVVNVSASGGTGTFQFSIDGDNHGLTIDQTGALYGRLPGDEGPVKVSVRVSDGVSTQIVDVNFLISKTLPVGSKTRLSDKEWWEQANDEWNDLLSTLQQTAINTNPTYAEDPALYDNSMITLRSLLYTFLANPSPYAIPVVRSIIETMYNFVFFGAYLKGFLELLTGTEFVLLSSCATVIGAKIPAPADYDEAAKTFAKVYLKRPPISIPPKWGAISRAYLKWAEINGGNGAQ